MPSLPKLALSTCWLSQRHTDGLAMLGEVADLGFSYTELGHGIPLTLVPGILEALEKGIIKVSSTHNFCPLPPGVTVPSPNYYEPTAGLSSGREQWVRHTLNSIAFAKRVGADRMVAHMGSFRFFFGDPSQAFRRLYADKTESTLTEDADYIKARERLIAKLKRNAKVYYQRVHDALSQVAEAANAANIRIGLENRDGVMEVPLDTDMTAFFEKMEDLPFVGSWHDCGHSRIKERMGLAKVADMLDATDKNRVGFHLHNVTEAGRDHQAVTTEGTVDFDLIQKHIRPTDVVVLEFSSRVKVEDVRASRVFAEKLISAVA